MNGMIVVCIGIGAIALSIILFIASFIYRNVTGKKIREELNKEYMN